MYAILSSSEEGWVYRKYKYSPLEMQGNMAALTGLARDCIINSSSHQRWHPFIFGPVFTVDWIFLIQIAAFIKEIRYKDEVQLMVR